MLLLNFSILLQFPTAAIDIFLLVLFMIENIFKGVTEVSMRIRVVFVNFSLYVSYYRRFSLICLLVSSHLFTFHLH